MHGVTSAFVIPATLSKLLQARRSGSRLDIELVISGGFLPLAVAEKAIGQLTERLTIVYAATECIAVLHSEFRSSDDLYWLTPYSERIVQIVDEHGTECPIGEEGELRILLRDTDAAAYLDDEETSARFFRDGFFYPGDMAVKRADGRIRVLGRTAEVLNVRGHKIAVAPLEDAIQRHLQVEAVCLFSGLNGKGEDELVVAIQSHRDVPRHKLDAISRLDVIAGVVAAFGGFRFVILTDFPRTQSGMNKIQRSALRTRLFQ
jgi:acyl-coenzyme A synthetase/AMP-(fatty) acid ligase